MQFGSTAGHEHECSWRAESANEQAELEDDIVTRDFNNSSSHLCNIVGGK